MAMAVGEGGEQGATGGRLPRRPPGGAAPAQQRLLRRLIPRSATAALTSALALVSYPCDSFARSHCQLESCFIRFRTLNPETPIRV